MRALYKRKSEKRYWLIFSENEFAEAIQVYKKLMPEHFKRIHKPTAYPCAICKMLSTNVDTLLDIKYGSEMYTVLPYDESERLHSHYVEVSSSRLDNKKEQLEQV